MKNRMRSPDRKEEKTRFFAFLRGKNIALNLAGSLILAFGVYEIHSFCAITEGGVIGLTLLLQYWFSLSPALTNFILTVLFYALGFKKLGFPFLLYSVIAFSSYSLFYAILETTPPLFPCLSQMPLVTSILGALFVGVGAGLCVRGGGAQSGDDALAMSLCAVFPVKIWMVYLFSDLIVLLLSLTYLPFSRFCYSLLTVVLSGQIIGLVSGNSIALFGKRNKDEQ